MPVHARSAGQASMPGQHPPTEETSEGDVSTCDSEHPSKITKAGLLLCKTGDTPSTYPNVVCPLRYVTHVVLWYILWYLLRFFRSPASNAVDLSKAVGQCMIEST
jgi:hypothetical protein